MESPSLPEGLQQALAGIRDGLHLKWNPRAKTLRAGSIDVYGNARDDAVYDGRWELWDTTPEGQAYRVMMLQWPSGDYRQPGFWLIELLHYINPARFGGDVNRLLRSIVDQPNKVIEDVSERDLDDLVEQAAKWHVYHDAPKQSVLSNLR